jgi:hypothetical protein
MGIEKTYESIRKRIRHILLDSLDSLDVVKQVEEYRQFWKPKEIKVVLLAESHVHTIRKDYAVRFKSFVAKEIPDYPLHFVRFVYCLGYGESQLLERAIQDNRGTWQFWKMFSHCIREKETKVEKMGTPELLQRLRNKLSVLRKMQQKGVWLLDASIVGLARSRIKEEPSLCEEIIRTSWDGHVKEVIKESQPKHIIVVGIKVKNALLPELQKLNIDFTPVSAPQDRLSSEEQQENYNKCREICERLC